MSTWSPPLSTRIGFRQLRTWSPVLAAAPGPQCGRAAVDGPVVHMPSAKAVTGAAPACVISLKSPRCGSPLAAKAHKAAQVVAHPATLVPRSSFGTAQAAQVCMPTPSDRGLASPLQACVPTASDRGLASVGFSSPHPRAPSPMAPGSSWQAATASLGISIYPPPAASPAAGATQRSCTPSLCSSMSHQAGGCSLSTTPGTGTSASVVPAASPVPTTTAHSCQSVVVPAPSPAASASHSRGSTARGSRCAAHSLASVAGSSLHVRPAAPRVTSRPVRQSAASTARVRRVVQRGCISPLRSSRGTAMEVRHVSQRSSSPCTRGASFEPPERPRSVSPSVGSLASTALSAVPSLVPVSRAPSLDLPLQQAFPVERRHQRVLSMEPPAQRVLSLEPQRVLSVEPPHQRICSLEPPEQRYLSLEPPWQALSPQPLTRAAPSMEPPLQLSPPVGRRCSSPPSRTARSCSPPVRLSQPPPSRLQSAPQSPLKELQERRASVVLCQATPQGRGTPCAAQLAPPRADASPLPRYYGPAVQGGLGCLVQGPPARHGATAVAAAAEAPRASLRLEPTDMLDQIFWLHLMGIDQESQSRLDVKRLGAGKYEVDGRRVSLHWGPGAGEGELPELLVREDEVNGGEGPPEVPLPAYLVQAANVAAALKGRVPGAPAVARIPQEKRLTFGSTGSGALESLDVLQRCASMRKACEEARLRERAAEAYERRQPWRVAAMPEPRPAAAQGA